MKLNKEGLIIIGDKHMLNFRNRYFLGFLAIFLFIALAGLSCNRRQELTGNVNNNGIVEEQLDDSNDTPVIGGEKDEHGCLVAAGYSWCEAKQKCLRTWEEACSTEGLSQDNQNNLQVWPEIISWDTYQNAKFSYQVEYPNNLTVASLNPDEYVEFIGPLVGDKWWPYLSVSHRDESFFHPEADISVQDWVVPFPEMTLAESRTIDGLPAVHYLYQNNKDNSTEDYYYFIHDGQLFEIMIVDSSQADDQKIYDKFLDSFHFVDQESTETSEE